MTPHAPVSVAGRVARLVLDFAFPPCCLLCMRRGATLCAACRGEATRFVERACARCAAPFAHAAATGRLCGRCLRRLPAFEATWAAARFEPPFDRLVRGLKYAAQLHHAPVLADLVARRIEADAAARDALASTDRLIAVPIARDRLAARGFNQSLEIARRLAPRIGVALDTTTLLRVRDAPPQAALRFDARRRNIRGAFAVALGHEAACRGLRVAVVDDVMTTGATLDEVARVLRRHGAARVVNVVVARTP